MRNILKIIIVCMFIIKSNAQTKIFKNNFIFEKTKVDFLMTGGSSKNGSFYIIIKDDSISLEKFNIDLKECLEKKKTLKSDYYYLVIPKEFSKNKDKLVLEFIDYILESKKLLDSQMNIISDGNYFNLYEQTRLRYDNLRKDLIENRKKIAREKKSNLSKLDSQDTTLTIQKGLVKVHHLNKINTLLLWKKTDSLCKFLK